MLKRDLYEQAGVAAYWVVDPVGATITAWTLRGGTYGPERTAAGSTPLSVQEPFPVVVVPDELARP